MLVCVIPYACGYVQGMPLGAQRYESAPALAVGNPRPWHAFQPGHGQAAGRAAQVRLGEGLVGFQQLTFVQYSEEVGK